jgi:arsenate reductase (thioredoxin)
MPPPGSALSRRRSMRDADWVSAMPLEPFNVLFLSTGNSARSILAECILDRTGGGRFRGYSAGSMPIGAVDPHILNLLRRLDYPTDALRSKSWDELAGPDAPEFDFIITVSDAAAGEICPIRPGKPMKTHWSIPGPADVKGTEAEIAAAFAEMYRMLQNRIDLLVSLPMDKLEGMSLKQRLDAIGME